MSVASSFERQMLDLINQERTSRGIDPLTLELRLNEASEDHSTWMDDSLVFSHTGVNGSDPGDRMRDAGFVFSGNWTWGENIAYQSERGAPVISDDVVDLHNSLMNSPGHRANILNPNFELIGIGIEEGANRGFDAVYVTQNFARTSAPVQLDGGGAPDPEPTPTPDPLPPATDQQITGDGGDNELTGGSGRDTLVGLSGQDLLYGKAGHDRIEAGSGADRVFAGGGADLVRAGAGNDNVKGGYGQDSIYGEAGRDRLMGDQGNDFLHGGSGRDRLWGDNGNDRLHGGWGNDTMEGGQGADTFVFSHGRDVVVDFDTSQGGDRIDMGAVASVDDFQDLLSGGLLRQSGGNTTISDQDGNLLVLQNIDSDALSADHFVF